ncbi:unnamed protein product, partial [Hymenolepis diminuta]
EIILRFGSHDNNDSVSSFRARTTIPTDRPVALIRAREPSPVQQTRPTRVVSSPPRTLPTQRDSNSETEIALKPGENVKIVYETRPINGNARENEQRRSKSAAQPTIRVGRDYSPARINGASKILYATEPETNDYPNVQISRSSYTNAGERQDVTVTTTTESISTDGYPNHKPSYGFVVDPQFPERRGNNHEVTKRDGENGIGFESSRPSGIPYFDYGSDNNIDTNVNGMRRERNDVYLETSYLTSGPAPNMRIQGRTIRSDNSTYLPNDTPLGGVALDDTLETDTPRSAGDIRSSYHNRRQPSAFRR